MKQGALPISAIILLIIALIGVALFVFYSFGVFDEGKGQFTDLIDVGETGIDEGIQEIQEQTDEITGSVIKKITNSGEES